MLNLKEYNKAQVQEINNYIWLVKNTLKITRGDVSLAIDALSDIMYKNDNNDTALFILNNRAVFLDFLAEHAKLVSKENGLIVYNLDGFNYKFAE